jgi:ATP adenylyltransferase
MDYTIHIGKVSKALIKLWNADKVDNAIFGDVVNHQHIHIVPKRKESFNGTARLK